MTTDMASDEYRVEIPVPQVTQKHSWDCGLACAVAVLRYFEKDSGSVYDEDLKTLGCGESVWTVDLAHLMALHKIRHHFCTTFIGVDKCYSKKSFYARNFTRDEERVNKLFEEAESHGISLEQRSVPLDDIYRHLRSENIIIVLVDWEHLECIWCDIKICPRLNCFKGCCGSYQGHYVVVCGADTSKGHIYYMNPAYKKGLCCSRAEKFDIARKSHGTDEDILFLYNTNHLTDPKLEGHR